MPKNWIINFEERLWPSNFRPSKISSAIKTRIEPTKNWKKCSIIVLCKSIINDYYKATIVANMAQFTSDCEAMLDQESHILTKKKYQGKKNYFIVRMGWKL